MRIYQVEIQNGLYEDKTIETVLCTTDIEKAIDKAKIEQFDKSFVTVNVWENDDLIKSLDVDYYRFEEKLRNL